MDEPLTTAQGIPCALDSARIGSLLAEAVRRKGAAPYEIWFRNSTRLLPAEGGLCVCVPNAHLMRYLSAEWGGVLRDAGLEVLGHPLAVRFRVAPEAFVPPTGQAPLAGRMGAVTAAPDQSHPSTGDGGDAMRGGQRADGPRNGDHSETDSRESMRTDWAAGWVRSSDWAGAGPDRGGRNGANGHPRQGGKPGGDSTPVSIGSLRAGAMQPPRSVPSTAADAERSHDGMAALSSDVAVNAAAKAASVTDTGTASTGTPAATGSPAQAMTPSQAPLPSSFATPSASPIPTASQTGPLFVPPPAEELGFPRDPRDGQGEHSAGGRHTTHRHATAHHPAHARAGRPGSMHLPARSPLEVGFRNGHADPSGPVPGSPSGQAHGPGLSPAGTPHGAVGAGCSGSGGAAGSATSTLGPSTSPYTSVDGMRPLRQWLPIGLPAGRRFSLDEFIVGDNNRLAHNAACQVAARPGAAFNPLFIHGGSGLGKTHLLLGVAARIAAGPLRSDGVRPEVCYLSGEDFTNLFLAALRSGKADAFRREVRSLDVLVLDDVHFLAGKDRTQEEFLNTFKSLESHGRQVVLASDRPPRELDEFRGQLVSRFVAGMVTEVRPPDLVTRRSILESKAARMGLGLTADVVAYAAEAVTGNVRELEGALNALAAVSHGAGGRLDVATAAAVLPTRPAASAGKAGAVLAGRIERAVAEAFGVPHDGLIGSRRGNGLAAARMALMYLLREHTGWTLQQVADHMGRRNHSTVVVACRKMRALIDADTPVEVAGPSREGEPQAATGARSLIKRAEDAMRRLQSQA